MSSEGIDPLFICQRCSQPTDAIFYIQSGGLCGVCLADDAIPLTPADEYESFIKSHYEWHSDDR